MPSITPSLWFDSQAEDAANFYVSVFPNSKINALSHYGEGAPFPAGTVLTADFELDGKRFQALNGGPYFTISEAISFVVDAPTQEDIDYYWNALTADGGEESQCGWLKDKFGVSWQIVPPILGELMSGPDAERAGRVMQAMLGMKKLDIEALTNA
ncbi:VOC family protein [Lysinibacter cavernae]|uniref:Putative 3-demethylubiquinone-9 3-methyltransferase (Glyoxalase superfamily) n=1 Tax=Lysinibacter cavernae TaxID=1640652 RepID=A0A7X5TV38_9MICO|nr:VOC family protein [Lysinibacter cavernae]NIH54352.1 putative 3-demethylubiquinone-9 3-methyltransferase (glyoxalase superfamily) [Lysinibacter cavernae]